MSYDISINDIESSDNSSIETGVGGDVSSNGNAVSQEPQTFTYKANGQEISEPIDTILQRASQGYNYAQSMQKFKEEQSKFEQSRQEYEKQVAYWKQYDEYAKTNPEWADYVRNQWENRNSFGQQQQLDQSQQTSFSLPPEISQQLNELKQFKAEYEQTKIMQRQAEEDHALANQIESLKKEHPDVDFNYSDPATGKTLEYQILEHAQANGINSFRAAFRDFYFDKIITNTATKTRETAMKELQDKMKKGIVAESNEPFGKFGNQTNKNMSYFDLVNQGGKEMGLF